MNIHSTTKPFRANRVWFLLDKYGLVLLVVFTFIAFIFAWIETYVGKASINNSFFNAFMDTVNSDSGESQGWSRIMHFFLSATIAWGAVRAYLTTAGHKFSYFMAKYLLSKHTIIIAGRLTENTNLETDLSSSKYKMLPDKSALAIDLAITLARNRQSVVLCNPVITDQDLSRLWDVGVNVIKSDYSMAEVLDATGGGRASRLIAMRDDYLENIVLVRNALSPTLENEELSCICMIEPHSMKRLVRLEDFFKKDAMFRLREFNESELVARGLILNHPPDKAVAQKNIQVHLMMFGFGSVGQAVLLQLAQQGHYLSGLKPKITVIDQQASLRYSNLLQHVPALADILEIEPVEDEFDLISSKEIEKWLATTTPTMIYVCTKKEVTNLRLSRLILGFLDSQKNGKEGNKAPDVVALDPPGGCILSDFKKEGEYDNFYVYSLAYSSNDREPSPLTTGLLTDIDDEYAQKIHSDYCKNYPTAEWSIPWKMLTESARNANRRPADHLSVKLRAVNRRSVPKGDAEAAPLSSAELEILSRMEHNRWCAERKLDGWVYGSSSDRAKKIHNNLVPYDDLDEDTKQKDRNNVKSLFSVVLGDDFVIALDN